MYNELVKHPFKHYFVKRVGYKHVDAFLYRSEESDKIERLTLHVPKHLEGKLDWDSSEKTLSPWMEDIVDKAKELSEKNYREFRLDNILNS
jgi:hypothetical protein